jgi:hypothetical protein
MNMVGNGPDISLVMDGLFRARPLLDALGDFHRGVHREFHP